MKYIKDFLQDIANAIKEKTKKINNIKTEDFVKEIDSLVVTNEHFKGQDKNIQLDSANETIITPDEGYNGLNSISITPKLQSKSVTLTSNTTTTVTPDSGYAGLSQVSVISNIGSGGLTYKNMWCAGDTSKSGSITIPTATTRAYLIINASTQNNFAGCSVSGSGLTISRVNSNDLGDSISVVNGGFRYSTFIYLITKRAGTARTLSVTWNGNSIRHSCPVLIY